MNIYLAGGMRSDWRKTIIGIFDGVNFFDPSTHGLTDEKDYTKWDLDAIDNSDVLFAYLEQNNPSGIGMALEIGYAFAKGKTIIFVEEEFHPNSRYFGMCRVVSTYNVSTLYEGIETLEKIIKND